MSDDILAKTPALLLHERFEIVQPLGHGGQGQTSLAIDRQSGATVVVKELGVERVESWKAVELFEREAKTLAQLHHAAIPAYVDAFVVEGQGGARFFLVQEFVEGQDLGALLAANQLFDEAQVRVFLAEMLAILDYLHAHSPPVIHRDIKPSNIVRRPSGEYVLIDFGAVQTMNANTIGGSTIVGTSGYMPHEQLMGRAAPGTDIYALAATAVHLLSGKHPGELPERQMRIDFSGVTNVSKQLERVLQGMLEPDVDARYASVARVLHDLLHGPSKAIDPGQALVVIENDQANIDARNEAGFAMVEQFRSGRAFARPSYSRITVERSDQKLLIRFPRQFFIREIQADPDLKTPFTMCTLGLLMFAPFFLIRGAPLSVFMLMGGIALFLMGLRALRGAVAMFRMREFVLHADAENTCIEHDGLFGKRSIRLATTQFSGVDMVKDGQVYIYRVHFGLGKRRHLKFSMNHTHAEKLWLASELRQFMGDARS
ncbi:MAG: serine/threonine protein kinase [Bradymonadaceae bacterium]|nr:serine/threonine protein kinase [Lujinxingiaceae bacterium]